MLTWKMFRIILYRVALSITIKNTCWMPALSLLVLWTEHRLSIVRWQIYFPFWTWKVLLDISCLYWVSPQSLKIPVWKLHTYRFETLCKVRQLLPVFSSPELMFRVTTSCLKPQGSGFWNLHETLCYVALYSRYIFSLFKLCPLDLNWPHFRVLIA